MVDFIRKRLQVFVSSTYEDLKQERQAAVEAILSAGHIPAGMELFAAGDEAQMEVIKQWIDQSDAYLLILGGRYGSVEPNTSKSYTQLEYEYAFEKKKALFACVVTKEAQEIRIKEYGSRVIENHEPKKLLAFRDLVLSRMSRFWSDPKDIKLAIHETLNEFSRREDLIGWVRPQHEFDMPALTDEIARLSKENALLRNESASNNKERTINGLKVSEIKAVLRQKELVSFIQVNRRELVNGISISSRVAELIDLGLLEPKFEGSSSYVLTKIGREIVNQMDFEFARSLGVSDSQ